MADSEAKSQKISIVGSGSIGAAWAIVFARAGFVVALNDISPTQLKSAEAVIGERLSELETFGLLGGDPATIASRIRYDDDLTSAVEDADLVIEAAPEVPELKRALFAHLAAATRETAILASSSSAITASAIAHDLPHRHRCLVAHPGNPPYLLPVVEIVPAEFTASDIVAAAQSLFTHAGMSVVTLGKEVEGFVFNRLQGAVLREAYCLVRDGVVSVDDLDKIIRDGLGMRYAFIGPFETSDLNVRGGITAHAARMGAAYERMGAERGQHDSWTPDLVATVASQRREQLPLDRWSERVAWRDRRLMALNRLKQDLSRDDG
ncbi:MAG TPA: 3-hydroxyacyl-CoA dehydrogenase [Shinella sp.]|jgi:3-hydroxyacyl-CoA dehydrogenase|uniref:3-hydroxyacyl-CoA dehydrogenase n=1 Tax=Shinella sp. TaxID=1870904 RepID=UPI002E102D96|nr:3-hydroxyacyl-CoA dehydrogenase [Shinella sp.]